MPEIGLGIQRAIDGESGFFPALPAELLRQLSGTTQTIEKLGIAGLRFQEYQIEAPQACESLIVELQALLAVEDGDGRSQMIERLRVAFERAFSSLHGWFQHRTRRSRCRQSRLAS